MMGLHAHRSPAAGKSLAEAIRKANAKTFKQRTLAEQKLLIDWPEIVGLDYAMKATPLCIRRLPGSGTQVLDMSVLSANAPEIQMAEPQILEKIATYFGHSAISRIKIHQQIVSANTQAIMPTLEEEDFSIYAQSKDCDDPLVEALESLRLRVRKQYLNHAA